MDYGKTCLASLDLLFKNSVCIHEKERFFTILLINIINSMYKDFPHWAHYNTVFKQIAGSGSGKEK